MKMWQKKFRQCLKWSFLLVTWLSLKDTHSSFYLEKSSSKMANLSCFSPVCDTIPGAGLRTGVLREDQ